eukprot:2589480-Pyramimonas_sp.AAC.1
MVAIAVDGSWPKRRRFQAGLRDDSMCDRCGHHDESPLHRTWLCSCNSSSSPGLQRPRPEAIAESEAFPCFWLRGLIPSARTR